MRMTLWVIGHRDMVMRSHHDEGLRISEFTPTKVVVAIINGTVDISEFWVSCRLCRVDRPTSGT